MPRFFKILFSWIILSFSITLASLFLPFIAISGSTTWEKLQVALAAGFLLGVFNLLVRPIIKILSIPINILTLGLFNIIINAGILWLVDYFIDGLDIEGFWSYLWSSLLISIINIIITKIVLYERKKR